MEIIKENLIDNSPNTFTIYEIETILKRMEKNICKIEIVNPVKKATGFFCNFTYHGEDIKALITCNHVIDSSYVDDTGIIYIYTFSKNNDNAPYSINLKEKRIILYDEEYDITLIELKSEEIKDFDFLDLDEGVDDFADNKSILNNENLYILHYPKGTYPSVSFGQFKKEYKEYSFFHSISTDDGSSGSPILSKNSKKVIGIHIGAYKTREYNVGSYLKYFIKKNNAPKKKKKIKIKKIKKTNKSDEIKCSKNYEDKDEDKKEDEKSEKKEGLRYKNSKEEKKTNVHEDINNIQTHKNNLDNENDNGKKIIKRKKTKKRKKNMSLPKVDNNKPEEIKAEPRFKSQDKIGEKELVLPILIQKLNKKDN